MNKKPLVIAVGLVLSNLAQAAPTSDVTQLDEVLVSATRDTEKVSETSRSVAVVNEQQIEQLQPDSVADALAGLANVSTTNGPRASSQGVEIRGLSGQRVLQTIDGARQNTSSGHRGNYFMDPELLRSIEVVRGPASSLWGSGAIGGVVAQNTKRAQDLLEPGQQLGGYLKQAYETNGDRIRTSAAVYGQTDSLDWLINGSFYDSNNIKTGNDLTLPNSGGNGNSGLAKLGWQIDDAQLLSLSGRINNTDELVPSNPAVNVSRSVPLVKRKTQDSNLTLNYELSPEDNAYLDTKALIYLNHTEYDEDRVTRGQQDNTKNVTLGFSVNNRSEFDFGTLTYGVDGYQDKITTVRDDRGQMGQRPDNLDGKSTVLGGFVKAKIGISDAINLEPSVRFDSFRNESNSLDLAHSDSAWSPALGLTWQSTPWLTLSARYDSAFRAPSVEEMYSTGTHYCIPPIPGFLPNGLCNTFQINPDLKAEKAANKELKADMRFANLLGNDELAITVNLFRNDVDDFIEQLVVDPMMGIPGLEQHTTWRNVDKAKLTGFEVSSAYRYQLFKVQLNYGQTEGKDKQTDQYLANIPAHKWVLDLSQGVEDGDITFGTRVTHVSRQDQLSGTFASRDYQGYTLWDVYTSWQPSTGALTGLKLDLALENIGDEQYRQAWQTLDEQGRNIKLSARYQF